MDTIFILLALVFVCIFVTSSILIFNYLKKRGEKIHFIWLRFQMIPNASKYASYSKAETGRTGPLLYWWVISINLALLMVVLLFLNISGII
ncbi:MAG: hypothetical protein U9N53_04250 [Bacteroidota bacterium]|nr:hypothetical protein [Bacteroidota bacterium]